METQHCDLLVSNAQLFDSDRDSPESGAIAVKDGTIVAVGDEASVQSRYTAARRVNADGGVLHPGFIDAHLHASQYSSRTTGRRLAAADRSMGDWNSIVKSADEVASVQLTIIDLLQGGFTGFVEPGTVFDPEPAIEAIKAAGIRAWVTDPYVGDQAHIFGAENPKLTSPEFLARWPQTLDEAAARLGNLAKRYGSDDLVHGYVGLFGAGSQSDELYAEAVAVARDLGVTVQMHLNYMPGEALIYESENGRTYIERLADTGQIGPNSSFVHMNRVTQRDVEILASANAAVVWNPYGQLQATSLKGFSPRFRDVVESVSKVGLGTDIPHIISPDGLGTIAVASSTASGTPLTSGEVFHMRTVGSARSIGSTDVGLLKEGYRADFVVRWPDAPQQIGVDGAEEFAVLPAGSSVRHVFVNGEDVFRDGRPTRLDQAEVVSNVQQSARRLLDEVVTMG